MVLMGRSVGGWQGWRWTRCRVGGIVGAVEARGGRQRSTATDACLRWVVLTVWVVTVVLVVMALVLLAMNGPAPSFGRIAAAHGQRTVAAAAGALCTLAFATVGATIVWHRRGQVLGWLGSWVSAPALLLVPLFCFLLFPDGRLPAPRWRLVAWLDGLILAMATVGPALRPGPLVVLPSVANPLGASGMAAHLAGGLLAAAALLLPLAVAASVGSLIVRLRRARGAQRQQLKWFASAAALVAVIAIPV